LVRGGLHREELPIFRRGDLIVMEKKIKKAMPGEELLSGGFLPGEIRSKRGMG